MGAYGSSSPGSMRPAQYPRIGADSSTACLQVATYGIMQLLAILLVRSRTDWCAGVGSPLAGDHRSQATFLLHDLALGVGRVVRPLLVAMFDSLRRNPTCSSLLDARYFW